MAKTAREIADMYCIGQGAQMMCEAEILALVERERNNPPPPAPGEVEKAEYHRQVTEAERGL